MKKVFGMNDHIVVRRRKKEGFPSTHLFPALVMMQEAWGRFLNSDSNLSEVSWSYRRHCCSSSRHFHIGMVLSDRETKSKAIRLEGIMPHTECHSR